MKNWDRKKLSELSKKKDDVVSGPFGSNLKVSDYKEEGVPILRLQNIGKGFFIDKEIKFINESKAEELKYHSFISGDIALAKLGIPIGKTCIIPDHLKSGIITADIVRIRPDKNIVNYSFLEYFLNTDDSVSQLTGNISGATRPRVNLSDVRNIEVPIPSLSEQQRIVAILNEAFASFSRAKANAEQNLKNAKEIFESYLQELFFHLFHTSEKKTISSVAKVIGGYSFKSTDFKKVGAYQVIRMGNVRPGIIREQENPVFIDKMEEKAFTKALLLLNDVIITQTGTKKKRDYGFTTIIEKENYLLNQRIASIRFSDNYLPKFFLYFSWTNIFKDQYFSNETGTVGQGNVGIGAITDSLVPFIPLSEQQSIVQKLDTLSTTTERLKVIYIKKLSDLEELKKSILQKAFNGELNTIDKVQYELERS